MLFSQTRIQEARLILKDESYEVNFVYYFFSKHYFNARIHEPQVILIDG